MSVDNSDNMSSPVLCSGDWNVHMKEKQKQEVIAKVRQKGLVPPNFVDQVTHWFYHDLSIDETYFACETVENIVNHIHTLHAARVDAFARGDKHMKIRFARETSKFAIYFNSSEPGVECTDGPGYEERIDEKYLNSSKRDRAFRVESFRSSCSLLESEAHQLRCYFVWQCEYSNLDISQDETNIELLGDKKFLLKTTSKTKKIYMQLLQNAVERTGPVIEYFKLYDGQEYRLVLAYKQGTAMGIFSALSSLYHYYGLTSTRKYIEQFANGFTVMSVYLRSAPNVSSPRAHPTIEASIHQIVREFSLLYCIPLNAFRPLFNAGQLYLQESVYAHCVWVFTTHFLNRLGSEYQKLATILDPHNLVHAELLSRLKKRLRSETFTAEYILQIISTYPELIHKFYLNFVGTHYVFVDRKDDDFVPTLSNLLNDSKNIPTIEELEKTVVSTVVNERHEMVMQSFCVFNKSVLKTNFYTPTKVAISFRLDPKFLPESEYAKPLFGMFLVIGSEFRGFHLRFKDIARGGIRIVTSRTIEAYSFNSRGLFDENYNLAHTQQRKNKDIPEGGSKGVILLDFNPHAKKRVAFEKYIDAILDLLLKPHSPGIKDPIVDLYKKEEILFMGPDENTADLVDWATEHARTRGAKWWKSFFTGKSPRLGGIPHDKYGMTTLSVREYVTGIYRKLGIDECKVRKMQTGGPDGDLGSNEILLSNEMYCAIVDVSGVLFDPHGMDREELTKMARGRKTIAHFDISKLSKDGYRVLAEDNNVKLPSGEVVVSGAMFRNTFYLRAGNYPMEQYTVFVPCGGRPESIDISNVNQIISSDNKSNIDFIVEGANLFITQDAKLRIEEAGCIIFKDSSVNKGGVTSSSLEVLASLSFDTAGFMEHMCVHEGSNSPPEFYQAYVAEVQEIIKNNARLEFEAIWREHEASGCSRSIISDRISEVITKLDEELQRTSLWNNKELRVGVLRNALPKVLLNKLGLETIMERVPETYLRAIFGSFLSSRFVYEYGISADQFAFFMFMHDKKERMLSEERTARPSNEASVTHTDTNKREYDNADVNATSTKSSSPAQSSS